MTIGGRRSLQGRGVESAAKPEEAAINQRIEMGCWPGLNIARAFEIHPIRDNSKVWREKHLSAQFHPQMRATRP